MMYVKDWSGGGHAETIIVPKSVLYVLHFLTYKLGAARD